MGLDGADERIALRIDTSADPSGIRQVRSEVAGLGSATKAAADQAAAAATAQAGAERTLAAATRTAAAEQGKLTATVEQSRAAWAQSGGDMTRFAALLNQMVNAERTLAAAASETSRELEKQARVVGTIGTVQIGPSLARVAGDRQLGQQLPTFGPQQGPGGIGPESIGAQLGPAFPGLRTAEAAAASAAAIQKIPPAARTAGNALGLLAQAAVTGQGGMNGLAVAAGNVAQGIALMSGSAKAAAAATGLGAVIAIAFIGIEALNKLAAAATTSQRALDHVAGFSTRGLQQALAERDALDKQIAAATEKVGRARYNSGLGDELLAFSPLSKAQAELDQLLALKNTLSDKTRELSKQDDAETRDRSLRGIAIMAQAQVTAQGRYRAQLREIEAERAEAIRSRELTESAANTRAEGKRRALATEGETYINGLAEAAAASRDAMAVDSFTARKNAADRAYEVEKKAIQDRALSAADEKAALDYIELKRIGIIALAERERAIALGTSVANRAINDTSDGADPRAIIQAKLDLIALEEKSDTQRLSRAEAQAIADEKRRKLQKAIIDEGLSGYARASTAASLHGSVVAKVSQAAADAVRRYEIYIQAKKDALMAKSEFAAATAAFARYDVLGGSLHLAAAGGYAAAAIAGGAEAVSGGGGASGSGGVNSDSTTFQPRGAEGQGGQTIILQTVNPFSREVIGEAIYQIGRAGTLKRPIPIAPTTGLMGAA